ncbi:aprataxin and PNK-like factor isoform X2 [Pteropus vampyrus]|uniref:Aprataxin and PNK-like factor n=1 Tax=Pteropus vampyrus TaxID=132908 RepID=A0A6P3QIU1_PTEVA|nr:aprataxin and PNK-like factor isoform X1 [Pteropus vampyrus]XP_011363896.1 aprataxin and PNK-like factor isoform X2 [Pteropus vampyrus]
MSGGFELQPQDGGPRVALAPGETVIGRGPLLGITDKRVSRKHAILEVVGGQLRIKPIHTNPCFYQSSEKNQLLPLKTNVWHWLNPGDSFSLLVDKYIFRVFSTYSEMELECTLRNSQMFDEDDILNRTPKSSLANLPDEATGAPQLERSTEIATAQTSTSNSVSFLGECTDFSKQQSNTAERKRILPAWMLRGNLSDRNLSAPVISGNKVTQESPEEGTCKDKTQVNITHQGRKRLISPGSSESTSPVQDTGKKCKNADQEKSIISPKEVPQSYSAFTLSNTKVTNMKTNTQRNEIPIEELGKFSELQTITKGNPNKEEAVSHSESCSSAQGKSFHDKSQGSQPESSSAPSSPGTLHAKATHSVLQGSEEKVKRTSCMYGANCYRKNPVHFQHFSHPGDSDYGGVQVMCQDEADDRPECPYGSSCYRKNPQHKIEYRHSTLPVRSTLDEDDDNIEQPSEHDVNDSSLDDEEEEYEPTDEDSDWEPGKEDQEKEDMEELVKEAKKFMKRKK